MPIDYSNSRIYRLVCNETGKCYYGSTTRSLGRRLANHKSEYKRWQEDKKYYITSFDVIAGGDYNIELVEECSDVTNRDQLRARERHYIESNECVNKYVPGRSPAESHAAYRAAHKAEWKAYQEAHKAERKAYQAAYYEANADKKRAYKRVKARCPHCGETVTRVNLPRHQLTKKCLAAQNSDL